MLTQRESIERGFGPYCYKKIQRSKRFSATPNKIQQIEQEIASLKQQVALLRRTQAIPMPGSIPPLVAIPSKSDGDTNTNSTFPINEELIREIERNKLFLKMQKRCTIQEQEQENC